MISATEAVVLSTSRCAISIIFAKVVWVLAFAQVAESKRQRASSHDALEDSEVHEELPLSKDIALHLIVQPSCVEQLILCLSPKLCHTCVHVQKVLVKALRMSNA